MLSCVTRPELLRRCGREQVKCYCEKRVSGHDLRAGVLWGEAEQVEAMEGVILEALEKQNILQGPKEMKSRYQK